MQNKCKFNICYYLTIQSLLVLSDFYITEVNFSAGFSHATRVAVLRESSHATVFLRATRCIKTRAKPNTIVPDQSTTTAGLGFDRWDRRSSS